MTRHWVSRTCMGERCGFAKEIEPNSGMQRADAVCGEPAEHKVEETIFDDDPFKQRHPLTCYLCHAHFVRIMGPMSERVRQMQMAALDPPST